VAGNVDDARRSLFDTVMDIVSIHWRVCHVALGVAFIVILYSALAGKLTNAAATVRKIIVGNRIDGIPGRGERDDSDNVTAATARVLLVLLGLLSVHVISILSCALGMLSLIFPVVLSHLSKGSVISFCSPEPALSPAMGVVAVAAAAAAAQGSMISIYRSDPAPNLATRTAAAAAVAARGSMISIYRSDSAPNLATRTAAAAAVAAARGSMIKRWTRRCLTRGSGSRHV